MVEGHHPKHPTEFAKAVASYQEHQSQTTKMGRGRKLATETSESSEEEAQTSTRPGAQKRGQYEAP